MGFGDVGRDLDGRRPSNVLNTAIAGAKRFKTELGLPSYQDIFDKIGGGFGTREFGNAGAAGTGASFARGEVDRFRGDMQAQQRALQEQRRLIANPTQSEGFKNVMSLHNSRLARASEDADRRANEAATRRGYVGGYNPASTERARLEALADAGYEAVAGERAALQQQFGNEADLYKAGLAGYGSALGAYTDLTKTYAELPTKYLDAYARLLGGAGDGFGSIFGTALAGAKFDTGREFELAEQRYGLEQKGLEAAEARRRAGMEYDFRFGESHTSEDERLARQRQQAELEKAQRGTSFYRSPYA